MWGNITLRVIELEDGSFAEFVQEGENEVMVYTHDKPYHASLFDTLEEADQVFKEAQNKDSDWFYYGNLNFKKVRTVDFTMK